VGCEARKIPAEGEVFFLDFAFYREVTRHYPISSRCFGAEEKFSFCLRFFENTAILDPLTAGWISLSECQSRGA
jgi:hypothetical protein